MQQAQVTMYTTQWCPYCQRARALLRSNGVSFDEIDIDGDPARRSEMITRSGRHTVPQIFVGDHHVGGSDDLHALIGAGGLNHLLTGH